MSEETREQKIERAKQKMQTDLFKVKQLLNKEPLKDDGQGINEIIPIVATAPKRPFYTKSEMLDSYDYFLKELTDMQKKTLFAYISNSKRIKNLFKYRKIVFERIIFDVVLFANFFDLQLTDKEIISCYEYLDCGRFDMKYDNLKTSLLVSLGEKTGQYKGEDRIR